MKADIAAVLAGEKRWGVVNGDCLDVLRAMPDSCVDSIVTDPPAAISFMGRDWDGDRGGRDQWVAWLTDVMRECLRVLKPGGHAIVWALPRTSHWTAWAIESAGFELRDSLAHFFGSGFPKSLSVSKAIDDADGLTDKREVVHSYTAGGNAGTSTAEKGGTYVTGAPNSAPIELHVTRGASERSQAFDGWGTALKPAHEVWWLARKPLQGTVAGNALKHGTGGLNIDACRVATDWNEPDRPESWKRSGHTADPEAEKIAAPPGAGIECHPGGRWPANVVFSHSAGCKRAGTTVAHGANGKNRVGEGGQFGTDKYGDSNGRSVETPRGYGTETVPAYDCEPSCPVRLLGEQSGESVSGGGPRGQLGGGGIYSGFGFADRHDHADSGTAARFFNTFEIDPLLDNPEAWSMFYCAKAATAEREDGLARLPKRSAGELTSRKDDTDGLKSPRAGAGRSSKGRSNTHPTVKPVALMRWLVRLITPPGGIVLDPFCGSGTTGVSSWLEDFRFIGIEREAEYVEIARARIAHAQRLGRQQDLFGSVANG